MPCRSELYNIVFEDCVDISTSLTNTVLLNFSKECGVCTFCIAIEIYMYYNLLLFRFPAGTGGSKVEMTRRTACKDELDAGTGGSKVDMKPRTASKANTKAISNPSKRENKVNISFLLFFGS